MRNRFAGNCNNCGKYVGVKCGHWRESPKPTRNFIGLRCKFCGETIKKNIRQIESRKLKTICQ